MSEENVETIKRAYAALNSGDIPTVLEFCDPEVEFDNSNAVFDAAVPVGDDQVLVPHRIVSVGRDGVETIARNTNVYTLNEGKATHIKSFQTQAEALEAARLRD